MPGAHQAREPVLRQPPLTEVSLRQRREVARRHVDVALLQRLGQLRVPRGHGDDGTLRCVDAKMVEDRRQKRHLRDVGESQHDRPRARGRVEVLAFEQILPKMLQVRPCRAHNRMGAWRRDDAVRPADKQRIVEGLAQPAQRLADGRLAHPELSGRAAHAQLVVERDRDGQQVEVGMLRCQPLYSPQSPATRTSVMRMSVSVQSESVNLEYSLCALGIWRD